MSKDFIHNSVLQDIADAIRFIEGSTAGIAPVDYADHIRALDKYIPRFDVLNFYMPDGGTIQLNKTGSPTEVELEYYLDTDGIWTIWQPDNDGNRTITLTAGQRMYVRNTSETSTGFSINTSNFYRFIVSGDIFAYGKLNSLLCKNPDNAVLSSFCFYALVNGSHLKSAPIISEKVAANAYQSAFIYCDFEEIEIPVLAPAAQMFRYAFESCVNLKKVVTQMTDISATDCLWQWMGGVPSTGDFYCPAGLTIPTGVSGIPSGWTRVDY